MATSQNGYTVRESSAGLDKSPLPGTDVTFPGGLAANDSGYVLRYVASELNKRVEKARAGWCWGYAYRPVRGQSSGFSNHASGTAIDYNAPKHPLGASGTFTAAQKAEIRKILDEVGGVVRWGGDYQNRKDEMHFEINAEYSKVQAVAAKLRAPKEPEYGEWYKGAAGTRTLSKFDAGEDVKKLQYILNRWYGVLDLDEDGYFGQDTEDGVKYLQGRAGLTADGVCGPKTWSVLNVT